MSTLFKHAVPFLVERIEAGIAVPCLIEMDAVNAIAQDLQDALDIIAQAVIGRVGDNSMHRPLMSRNCYCPKHQTGPSSSLALRFDYQVMGQN